MSSYYRCYLLIPPPAVSLVSFEQLNQEVFGPVVQVFKDALGWLTPASTREE